MLDFPTSPTNGQVYPSGGAFTWNSSEGVWRKGAALPPSDGKEYIRSNGVWRLKTEKQAITAATPGITFTVPATAKRGRFHGVAHSSTATAYQLLGKTDVVAAAGYQVVGWLCNTGTSLYQHQAATTAAFWYLSPNHNIVDIPMMWDGWIATERGATANNFSGQCQSYAYYTASTNLYMVFPVRLDLLAASTASLRLASITFYGSAAVNFTAESFIEMEWFY